MTNEGELGTEEIDIIVADIRNKDVAETGDNQLIIANLRTDCEGLAACIDIDIDHSESVVYVQEYVTWEEIA